MEEGVGVVVEGVGNAGGGGGRNKHMPGAVVGEGRSEVKSPLAMGSPRSTCFGGFPRHTQLPGGVDGVSSEVEGEAVESSPSGEGGVGFPRAEVVEGKFGLGEEGVPQILGEGNVDGRKDGDEVVFGRANRAFSTIRTVVKRSNKLDVQFDAS